MRVVLSVANRMNFKQADFSTDATVCCVLL